MFNIRSIYDLPSIGRLNTVHYDGVPNNLCLEHFLFLTESTQCAMEYDGNYRIVVRGFYSGKWHSSFYVVYDSPFIREILPIWYDTVASIVADQTIRHGFVDVYTECPSSDWRVEDV